jgi:ferric-dicitrate binding protein FerR (iron transport regulator)
MQPHITTAHTAAPDEAQRRRRIRRSALLFALIAAVFYFGFILMTLVRDRP